jgi:D-serine dehydratase
MERLGIDTLEPIVDTQPLYKALAQLASFKWLPKYTQRFMVKKLRTDIKLTQRALKDAEKRLNEFSPPPPKKRRKKKYTPGAAIDPR